MRFWELSGGVLRCPDCGRALVALSAWKRYMRKDGTRKKHFHYACATRRQRGKEACSYSRTPNAQKIETELWEAVKAVLLDPERLERGLDAYLEAEKRKYGGTSGRSSMPSRARRRRQRRDLQRLRSIGARYAKLSCRARKYSPVTGMRCRRHWRRPRGRSAARCTIPSGSPSGPR